MIRSLKNHFVNVPGIPFVVLTTREHDQDEAKRSQGDDRLSFEIQGEHRFRLLDLTKQAKGQGASFFALAQSRSKNTVSTY